MNDDLEDVLSKESIVLGAGCFWGTEAVFKMLKGIISVKPGYAGGAREDLTYEEISSGSAGHAEVVKIKYCPKKISLDSLLAVFFSIHNPTHQSENIGGKYRSIILCTSLEQKKNVRKFIEKLIDSGQQGSPIITEVRSLDVFHTAESNHINYFENHSEQAYCQTVIGPKLKKVQKEFPKLLQKKLNG
jgi:methionine-S-sulfoxide reductase